MDNIKTLTVVGVIVVLIIGIAWLLHNLGLGPGMGGKGPGEGPGGSGTGTAPAVQPKDVPPSSEKQTVLVTGARATLNGKAVTPEEIAQRAKAGESFVIQDAGSGKVAIMEEFIKLAKTSEGRIIVKE